jgi:hypothetical protein
MHPISIVTDSQRSASSASPTLANAAAAHQENDQIPVLVYLISFS